MNGYIDLGDTVKNLKQVVQVEEARVAQLHCEQLTIEGMDELEAQTNRVLENLMKINALLCEVKATLAPVEDGPPMVALYHHRRD